MRAVRRGDEQEAAEAAVALPGHAGVPVPKQQVGSDEATDV